MSTVQIPAGLSTSEAELYEHLVTHAERERSMMNRYRALSSAPTGYIGFLAGLIAEDEERHHRLYDEWAKSIAAAAELREDGMPWPEAEDDPEAMLHAVQALLDFERRDHDQLKAMARSIDDMRETTIWGVVLDVMRADTDKHIKILTYIRDHIRKTIHDRR